MSQKNKLITLFSVLGGLIVIAGLGGLLVYGVYYKQNDAGVTRLVAKAFNMPAAKVGNATVSYAEFLSVRDAIRKFTASEAGKQVEAVLPPDKELNQNILERLIRQELTKQLADQKKITVADEDLNTIFQDVVKVAASSTTPDVNQYLLSNYGWNENDFREQVLRPALLEQKLAISMAGGDQTKQNAMEDELVAMRAKPEVVVYLKF
ncbi:MAG: SurA N-terminal domain-containing protein [Patescibacteria group bacterium]|nr:SurA N-terminal domain-containing protein [Patescibacteria group bacterium]